MGELIQDRLHETTLPLQYVDVLRAIDRFVQEANELRPRKETAEEREVASLRRSHDELMVDAREFFANRGSHVDERVAREAFAIGLLRCTYYSDTVTTPTGVVDSCGSRTLQHFELDVAQGPDARRELSKMLEEKLGFGRDDLDALERRIEAELDALKLRHDIVRALAERFPTAPDVDRAAHAMFTALYPGHPFREGDIQLVRTSTSLFFCIPFEGLALADGRGDDRPEEERGAIENFLRKWSKFKQRYYAHFPVFGFFRGSQADEGFVARLAADCGATTSDVEDALTTMVSILQSSELDKYIVHDAWGHQWQSLLFRFEETYRSVARYEALPAFDWRPSTDAPSLAEVFAEPDDATFDDRWRQFLRATVERRLHRSLAGLVAEVLADVVEYKFILLEPEGAANLLSSSFLKDLPTKLDLTYWDLPFYFKLALAAFIDLVDEEEARRRLAEQLVGSLDLSAEAARDRVDRAAHATGELLDFEYRRSLQYELADDHVTVNAFSRVALNFAAMQSIFNDLYEELREESTGTEGVERFHDPLVFAAASFLELDWHENFWHLDEFLDTCFPRYWSALTS